MPRKTAPVPVYEIATAGGTIRIRLTEDRRNVVFEHVFAPTQDSNGRFMLDGAGWRSLCDLRETLMPKRPRTAKA